MTKRFWAALAAALALCMGIARAEDMRVVHCEKWVSLREAPDTGARRLAEVPLGATVTDCQAAENSFTRCQWNGQEGYILTAYLETPGVLCRSFDPTSALGGEALMPGVAVRRGYEGAGEALELVGVRDGRAIWGQRSTTGYCTELELITAFPAVYASRPTAILYNATAGMAAIDAASGDVLWTLDSLQVPVGGSVVQAQASDGLLVIGGTYVTEPVAVDLNAGRVLWQAETPRGDIGWITEISIEGDTVRAMYDYFNDSEEIGEVVYRRSDGRVVSSQRYE